MQSTTALSSCQVERPIITTKYLKFHVFRVFERIQLSFGCLIQSQKDSLSL
jgi:hypothetical protein